MGDGAVCLTGICPFGPRLSTKVNAHGTFRLTLDRRSRLPASQNPLLKPPVM